MKAMIRISGYKITEVVYRGSKTVIYRGYRQGDLTPVVIKTFDTEYPTLSDLAQLKHEYKITQSLPLAGVVQSYSLEINQGRLALILEDFGGRSLFQFSQEKPLDIKDFLVIALKITQIIGQVHQKNIIHKDIKPHNIIINPQTDEVKLTDFAIASQLSRETQILNNPDCLEGTLPYLSPEQTGRMNRSLDYRTDFYSLGVTFYELLTGTLPFTSDNPLELVHFHLAKSPISPSQLSPEKVPQVLSDIVLKLMAKNAENRYQSAWGLQADLEECLNQWENNGRIENFILGKQDICDRFQIPQKLYGREAEIETLLTAFERVAGTGIMPSRSEIMLVSGYSGIGKSALVQEIYKPITKYKGYFIGGKFDQVQRNIPYAPILQAFQKLIQQLLTESEERIAIWREKLLAVLGVNGQVIIEVIPEVELIIGKQSPVPELGLTESQNRFNRVFLNFIYGFAQADHPLVIFLDDLQWADSASLKLIQLLFQEQHSQYLLLIGAYRNNEVSAVHPLMLTLDDIRKSNAIIQEIGLVPLTLSYIIELVIDTLHCSDSVAEPLAKLIEEKTQGNPFFISEFLKSLYQDGFLKFDYSVAKWQWDIEAIQGAQMTDNVIELMVGKIHKLSPQTEQVLKLAACIGNQFDLQTLAVIYEKSLEETASELCEAVQSGLILFLNSNYKLLENVLGLNNINIPQNQIFYKFLHDRVQQAAYFLIPHDNKQIFHQKIGKLLLKTYPELLEEKLFDIVNHLNFSIPLITEESESIELAQLNLKAGTKAKTAAAYELALNYFQVNLALLGFSSWQEHYELTLSSSVGAIEAAYLNGQFEVMEELSQRVLEKAENVLDKVKVYEVKIQACAAQNKMQEAVNTTLEILSLLGINFPENPKPKDVENRYQEMQQLLGNRSPLTLIDLPAMKDPHKLAAVQLMSSVMISAYNASPLIFQLLALQQFELLVKFGNSEVAASSYGWYGLFLAGIIGDIDTGYQFGQLALNLLDKFGAKEYKSKTIFAVNIFIRHWKEHLKETLNPLLESYQSGLEIGDFEYATRAAFQYCCHSYLMGKPLPELEKEMGNYSQIMQDLKQEGLLCKNEIYRQAALILSDQRKTPLCWADKDYNDNLMLEFLIEANDRTTIFMFSMSRLMVYYLLDNLTDAVKYAAIARDYLDSGEAFILGAIFNFYDSLTALATYNDVSKIEQNIILERVENNQKKMKHWSDHAPMNFAHKFFLVEAEKERILGNKLEAMDNYDRAITLAQEQGYIQDEALANELAAKFYLTHHKTKIAQVYLSDAHYHYLRWGATAKIKRLEQNYRELFYLTHPLTQISSSRSSSSISEELDLTTVIQASQAIAQEIVLDKLLAKLMKILLENAGATKGFLILLKDNQLSLEVAGEVEPENVTILPSIPLETSDLLPKAIVYYAIRTQTDVVLGNATGEGLFINDTYIRQHQPKSVLCGTILYQGNLQGVIYLENNLITNAFTPKRLNLLKILSSQAAISLENARLYQTLEEKINQRTAELAQVNRELQGIFTAINDVIIVYNRQGLRLKIASTNPTFLIKPPEELVGTTIHETMPQKQADLLLDAIQRALQTQKTTQVELNLTINQQEHWFSAHVSPLSDETVIMVARGITEQKQAEAALQQSLSQLAAANEEISLLNECLQGENLRMSAELGVTRQLQRMILPKEQELKAIDGLDIAGFMEPAHEVGGDYYDVLIRDDQVKIGIGDVTGHGLESGVLMIMVQTAVRTLLANNETDPRRFLSAINQVIYGNIQRMNSNKNLTLALLDYQGGSIKLSGQHEEILVFRSQGELQRIDTIDLGFFVGLLPDISDLIHQIHVQLEPGDGIVLYTDGITEAQNIQGEQYTLERLCQVVQENWQQSAAQIQEAVVSDLRSHIGEQKVYDDITLLVLKQK